MHSKKYIFILACAGALFGCETAPRPSLFNGQYYMAGDRDCVRARQLNEWKIMCSDESGRETMARVSLTSSELAAYDIQQQVNQQRNRQAMSEIAESFQSGAARLNAQAQAARNAQWVPPVAQPVEPPRTQTTCLVNGRYVYCKSQ